MCQLAWAWVWSVRLMLALKPPQWTALSGRGCRYKCLQNSVRQRRAFLLSTVCRPSHLLLTALGQREQRPLRHSTPSRDPSCQGHSPALRSVRGTLGATKTAEIRRLAGWVQWAGVVMAHTTRIPQSHPGHAFSAPALSAPKFLRRSTQQTSARVLEA